MVHFNKENNTMEYKGIELKEFTSDRPVVFDPPKKMLVWDDASGIGVRSDIVHAYLPVRCQPVQGPEYSWGHCAEIPEELPEETKPRQATNLELAKWLAKGNGMVKTSGGSCVCSNFCLTTYNIDDTCSNEWVVRKWDDKEWHEPTADYMGLEE